MPARPRTARAIDIHAHFFPEPYLKALAEDGGPRGVTVDFSRPAAPVLVRGGSRVVLDASYWDLDKRRQRMDAQGVTLHALSLTSPMVHGVSPDQGARLAQIVNDAMVEAHTAFPDHFVGCATLPMQEPGLTVKEIDRLAGNPGIRGVYLPTNVDDRELSDPDFFPIYERCQALGLPVLLHPVTVIGADRLRPFYLGNLIGNPVDSTIAAAHLVFGGVLDQYPRLEVVLPHAGGALPYLVGRLQRGQDVRPEAKNKAKHPFTDYLRRFHYDTISHSVEVLRFLVESVGADRVMLGSDYCFDMGYELPRDIIGQLTLRKADAAKILGGNAAQLLKL